MKNSISLLEHEGIARLKAHKAIQRIHKNIEDQYPNMAASARNRLIVECLIEMLAEKKYRARA